MAYREQEPPLQGSRQGGALVSNTQPRQLAGTVAITGGTGLIGRRLVPLLHALGAQVRVLEHISAAGDAYEVVLGDLGDRSAIRALVARADAVVHLAGVAHTALRSPEEQQHARVVNVDGTRALLDAAVQAGVKHFVLLSSAHVYAGQCGVRLDESSPTASDTAYGALKLEAEALAAQASGKGMTVTVLRPCLVYGPGVRFNLQSLLRAVHKGFYVHVRGAAAERSFTSVDVVSHAVVHCLGYRIGGTFNIADREPVILERWVDFLADMMDVPRPRTAPRLLLQTVAAVGTATEAAGLPAPFTRDSLAKLTSNFSLSTQKLAASGFVWPDTQAQVIGQMIDAEFGRGTDGRILNGSIPGRQESETR